MRSRHGIEARRGLLLAALCALALLAVPSVAAAKDRNNDRIPDKWEKRHKLSLKVNQAARDQDRDHLSNRGEFKSGMDPRDHDSDNDGVNDGDENAGTIASYDTETGKLVINLYGGDTISGFVTGETEIKCGHGCNRGGDDATVSHDGNSGPGSDSSGPGSGGDDDPAGHDQGDDDDRHHGEDNGASACTIEDLVEGAVVDEAELKLRDGKAVFEEIELSGDDEDGSSDS